MGKKEIKRFQRGLLFKDDEFERVLEPGEHKIPWLGGYRVDVMDVNQPFRLEINLLEELLEKDELVKELEIIELREHEIALRFEDGLFMEVLRTGRHIYWKAGRKREFIRVDLRQPDISPEIDPAVLAKVGGEFISLFNVAQHEKGLLFINGVYERTLEPGRHIFWKGNNAVTVQNADMRRRQLDMVGQEIMTEDKVSLRLNFVCGYRIMNPLRVLVEISGHEEQLYIALQLVLREYIGTLKLDDLLRKKEAIGEFVLARLREKGDDLGVEFLSAGVKDVILPGEIKEIMNMVLIAEKKAQANIITRREETASTRSLLNTAKLMEDNPTLYRLKELEYIERISERINQISLTGAGTGLLEQLAAALADDKRPGKNIG